MNITSPPTKNLNMLQFLIVHFPIFIACVGIVIHLLGITKVLIIADLHADIIMFLLDSLVVYGLLKRKKWGWWLAVLLFLQQSIMQPYWAYKKYLIGVYALHLAEIFIAPIIVCLCLSILLLNKKHYQPKVSSGLYHE